MNYKLFILVLVFLVGGLAGWFGNYFLNQDEDENHGLQIRQGGYEYINPLVECEVDAGFEDNNLRSFESVVENKIQELIDTTTLSDMSVYYRNLNNGPWFGIQEEAVFTPQSLLKVPVMMAIFKSAENNPEILSDKLIFSPINKPDLDANLQNRMEDGEEYTIEELINRMIKLSDNDAFYMLVPYIGSEKINTLHTDLGLITPSEDTPQDFISVKSYASLFRVLYNASYLNREMSEKALKILSDSEFKDGIEAGVPTDYTIAHKFGIRYFEDQSIQQLHDCGIIYIPNNPYLLCIMSKGSEINDLKDSISSISNTIFSEVNK